MLNASGPYEKFCRLKESDVTNFASISSIISLLHKEKGKEVITQGQKYPCRSLHSHFNLLILFTTLLAIFNPSKVDEVLVTGQTEGKSLPAVQDLSVPVSKSPFISFLLTLMTLKGPLFGDFFFVSMKLLL